MGCNSFTGFNLSFPRALRDPRLTSSPPSGKCEIGIVGICLILKVGVSTFLGKWGRARLQKILGLDFWLAKARASFAFSSV